MKEKRNALRYIAKKIGKKVKVILDFPEHAREANINRLSLQEEDENIEILEKIDIKEWIWHFKHSDFVATDSFHGTCFSIIFKKNFVAFANERRGSERVQTLLQPIGKKLMEQRKYQNHLTI